MMSLIIACFWVFTTATFLLLIGFVKHLIFRSKDGHNPQTSNVITPLVGLRTSDQIVDEIGFEKLDDYSVQDEKETPQFEFKFKFQIPENCKMEEKGPSSANVSKYRFSHEKDVYGFVEEQRSSTFLIQESYVGKHLPEFLPIEEGKNSNLEGTNLVRSELSVVGNLNLRIESDANTEISKEKGECDESELELSSESGSSNDGYSVGELIIGSQSTSENNFGSNKDGQKFAEASHNLGEELHSENQENFVSLHEESSITGHENVFKSEKSLEDSKFNEPINVVEPGEFDTRNLINEEAVESNSDMLGHIHGSENPVDGDVAHKKTHEENPKRHKEHVELEPLWEHQDLIEQLTMELKKVRAIGLPTIPEESESPKPIEELKQWKMDADFLQEDPLDELQMCYKNYRERMRKFDILNFQKMYAIGFLQLKDPLKLMGSPKQTIGSLFVNRRRKSTNDPSEKLVRELQSNLETVYVAQACLSWEFLRWQYEKFKDVLKSNNTKLYNQVAEEFQQFQVVMQRFLENEPFQGDRVHNYSKWRCVLRNLLQVPLVKEDCLEETIENFRKGNNFTTAETLNYIMEKSIRIFWQFLKCDKAETPVILKGLVGTLVELQNPTDSQLMLEVEGDLYKKEKKLKEIIRVGNCLVKKWKRHQVGSSNDDLLLSQVDVKLVSRVLKMTGITTDQLLWCKKKLSNIHFDGRKLHRDPCFCLFPC